MRAALWGESGIFQRSKDRSRDKPAS